MNDPEGVAHELVSAIGHLAGVTSLVAREDPEEDMRSGGYFFELEDEKDPSVRFTVLVVRSDL